MTKYSCCIATFLLQYGVRMGLAFTIPIMQNQICTTTYSNVRMFDSTPLFMAQAQVSYMKYESFRIY
jgi:hypothetical protein